MASTRAAAGDAVTRDLAEEASSFGKGPGALAPLRLATLRLGRSWRLLLGAGLGMLVAATLLAAAPIYATIAPDAALRQTLTTAPPDATNLLTQNYTRTVMSASAGTVLSSLDRLRAQYLAPYIANQTWTMDLDTTIAPPAPVASAVFPDAVVQPVVLDYASALPYMNVMAGRLPQETAAGQPPEVMVTPKLGLKPGDTLALRYSPTPGLATPPLTVQVVGVWYPKNPDDRFWNGRSFDSIQQDATFPPPVLYPLLFARETYLTTFKPAPVVITPSGFPAPSTAPGLVIRSILFPRLGSFSQATLDDVLARLAQYRRELPLALSGSGGIYGATFSTRLDTLLQGIRQQFAVLGQPLAIVSAQVAALALLFVAILGGLLVEAQAGEIATLKSRGGSVTQFLLATGLQGIILAGAAAAGGALLAGPLCLLIVRLFATGITVTGGGLPEGADPRVALPAALLGAGLGLAALLLATWRATRRDVLAFRQEQGREGRPSLWRRYYLDLGLALLCAVGYLELGQFGGLDVRTQLGQTQAGPDLLQLLSPGLLLVAGSLVALRLFPLLARVGAAVASRARGATGLLAFAQVARGATQFARLTLLLTLAVAVGLFALTFEGSLGRDAADRAAYVTGSDERVALRGETSGTRDTTQLVPTMAALPGVLASTPIYRTTAAIGASNTVTEDVALLGLDPATFAQAAFWRDDFADASLSSLMAALQKEAPSTEPGTSAHPLPALVARQFADGRFLQVGDGFTLTAHGPASQQAYFRVVGIVQSFPTMQDAPTAGYVVTLEDGYFAALRDPSIGGVAVNGPNEFWLRTDGVGAHDAARAAALTQSTLEVAGTTMRAELAAEYAASPLTAGMAGLLLAGAALAALLAALGSVAQAGVAARRRLTQFAVLRTLGTGGRQIVGMLLAQQAVIFALGLLGGTLVGLALATATLPFLRFSATAQAAATLQLPVPQLAVNLVGVAIFYAALTGSLVLALALGARTALRAGLGKTLRIGED